MNQPNQKRELEKERSEVLEQLEDWLETPMLLLGFGWLALLVVDLIAGLNPILEVISNVIWIVFVLDFGLRFTLAPHKVVYLKQNWLTALSLMLPALRIFRITRVIRLLNPARGLRLVRVITSLNRGMRSLRSSMGRRGFGYVISLSLVVTFVGAAGMYAFENNNPNGAGLKDYGTALWWTAMIMTTMGSEYWPQTPEGRVLCLILSLYAFGVFGYVTAAIATFFVGRDAENDRAEIAGAKSIAALHEEISALRADIQALSGHKQES
ncbi:ion transporter [Argonema galeatum]|uniref:ion transporter n=1 Tax=Argonema galeatum TaxID=2942762 RepID=UPI002012E96B|nr:ion transporter [Argonema galeatum]MCL1468822.1 ion transporter [Argonema galeatum A003/A1]